MVVEGWLARAAAARGERTALRAPDGECTYAQLLAAARAGAHELLAEGAGAGSRVAIELPAGLAFAQALHSCMLLGAVAVPVDPRLSDQERETVTRDADAIVREPLTEVTPPGSPAGEPGLSNATVGSGESGRGGHGGALAGGHDLDATAVVIHTSGTASAPRPVELTYGNLLWSALGSAVALGLDPEERWLCALPLSHVGGLSILVRSTIYATTAVVHERFDTQAVLGALRAGEVTLASLVATTLTRLLDAGLHSPPGLRCALTGGGPVPAPLVGRAHAAGVPVSLTYGLTEACSQVTTTPVAAIGERAQDPPSPGPPLFCTRVRIDAEGGSEGPAPAENGPEGALSKDGEGGREGEILVCGPTVAPGAHAEDGWLHTGDLGRLDQRGCLHLTGRKADTIVSGGENVAPAEVEAVLEAHPAVLEAAVVGRPDERWGEAVSAWVVARPGSVLDFGELAAHCRRALAPYKVPKAFAAREEPLPRTRSGKLLRRQLS